MKKSVFEGKWKEIRGKSKGWWSLINDIDLSRLDKSPEKLKKYVMLLQVKYGYSSKFAGEEINRRVEEQEAEDNKLPRMEPGKTDVSAPERKARKSRLARSNDSSNPETQ